MQSTTPVSQVMLTRIALTDTGTLVELLRAHVHPSLETIDLAFPPMSYNVELELTPGMFPMEFFNEHPFPYQIAHFQKGGHLFMKNGSG